MDIKTILDNLDYEELIDIVRSRPAIWNTSYSDYSDKIKRDNCWTEGCSQIFSENWEVLAANNKKIAGKYI